MLLCFGDFGVPKSVHSGPVRQLYNAYDLALGAWYTALSPGIGTIVERPRSVTQQGCLRPDDVEIPFRAFLRL